MQVIRGLLDTTIREAITFTTVRMFFNQAVPSGAAALESSWQFAGQTEFDVAAEKNKQTPHLPGNCST
ncbi:hypothetical protein AMR41_11030 [Hapalosiphon sp. MRB220]|nr:hypothetical protein AMR41_11030 [Hapalosiphon sp. MRB220]